jgi:DNA-binding transcriptional LysR family regulator
MFSDLLQQNGLSFDRLHSFCLVAEAGGVTKAARGDPARQSLYSRQIRELEEFFGVELIRRSGRGIVLTPAGASLNILVREQITVLADFKSECQHQPVEVVVGAGDSVIQWLLLPRLAEIREHFPGVRFKFLNLATADAVKRLADGMIDFAVAREDAVTRPLEARSMGVMGYALFIPQHHPAVRQNPADGKWLDNVPLATLEGEGSFRSDLAEIARKQKFRLNIQVECSSFPLAARAVSRGDVAAILPAIAATELAGLAAVEVKLSFLRQFDRNMCLATNPRRVRLRPILDQIGTTMAKLCQF